MFELFLGRTLFGFAVRAILVFAIIVLGLVFLWPRSAHAHDAAVGDSIALGTGQALHVRTYARQNMGSCWIMRHEPLGPYHRLLISAGINDSGACVASLRASVRARYVTWVLPAPINAGTDAVWAAVKAYGDRFVEYTCPGECSKTNFHPASYGVVAAAVRRIWSRQP